MQSRRYCLIEAIVVLLLAAFAVRADTPSGPKEGDKVPPLKAYAVNGDEKEKDVDFLAQRKDKPTIYVFVAAKSFDRPMFRFLKKLDEELPENASVVAVWLPADVDESKQYLAKIAQYFKKTALAVSDSTAGPKDWGINADAHLTAVVVNKGKVIKSQGFQSINETDAPDLTDALKKSAGSGSR
jgi:hypothetical protein